jgi:hypothetical protein
MIGNDSGWRRQTSLTDLERLAVRENCSRKLFTVLECGDSHEEFSALITPFFEYGFYVDQREVLSAGQPRIFPRISDVEPILRES